jgi:hypothetical protein
MVGISLGHDATGRRSRHACQDGKALVLDRPRQQGLRQLGRWTSSEGPQAEPLQALDRMPLPVPLAGEIGVDAVRTTIDLLGDEPRRI